LLLALLSHTVGALNRLRHENVVRMMDVRVASLPDGTSEPSEPSEPGEPDSIVIVLEYAEHDLARVITNNPGIPQRPEQVKCILEFQFPATCRIGLFSATMPPEVMEVAEKFLQNPVRILIPPENVTLDGIKQYYVNVGPDDKYKFDTLLDIYQHLVIAQLIIFVNTKKRAEWLAMKMREKGFTLECIHGEMDVAERKQRMEDFRRGACRVLISTDLLARGIDVQQVSMVINYELPTQHENYIHRIGRSGRFGRKGVAINLIAGDEINSVREIEKTYSTVIQELPEDLNSLAGV
jgi:superfamily II DNA/RNA helicase